MNYLNLFHKVGGLEKGFRESRNHTQNSRFNVISLFEGMGETPFHRVTFKIITNEENNDQSKNQNESAMTLPIYSSMIAGNLRQDALRLKDRYKITLLCQSICLLCAQKEIDLMTLEDRTKEYIERNDLADLTHDYEEDRALRRNAEKHRKDKYTPFNESSIVSFDKIFEKNRYQHPTERLHHLLAEIENRRTMLCLIYLVASAHDDALLQNELHKVMTFILTLCSTTKDPFIKLSLCQLYLELYYTFNSILTKEHMAEMPYIFEDVVYWFLEKYPDEGTQNRYDELMKRTKPTDVRIEERKEEVKSALPQPVQTENSRIVQFLKEANEYGFSELERVKALGTNEKIEKLVLKILNRSSQHDQPYGYAAAMLAFLGFKEQFKQYYSGQFRMRKYDRWCEINIMNYSKEKANGNAFKHYRQSVCITPNDNTNDNYKRLGWHYYNGIVQQDYNNILYE